MSRTVGTVARDDMLEEGEIHDVLRNDRRRLTIEALQDRDGTATVSDLSEEIAACETGENPPPGNIRQSVYVSLHQTHLPKLDELEIVEYDDDSKNVTLQERVEEVEVYMEVVPQYGLSWGEFYFGLALLGLLMTIAAFRFSLGISPQQLGILVSGYFLLQMTVSSYHVYSQQDQVIFHRLLD